MTYCMLFKVSPGDKTRDHISNGLQAAVQIISTFEISLFEMLIEVIWINVMWRNSFVAVLIKKESWKT